MEEVVDTIDANDEEGVVLEGMEYSVTNFTEMTKRMRMKYNKDYGTPEKMNPLVYIAPIFDPRYQLVVMKCLFVICLVKYNVVQ